MALSLLAIGSELLDGRTAETNSHWLVSELSRAGLRVLHSLSCDDSLGEITAALHYLFSESSAVIITGGLGPTTDDLTREAAAAFSGKPLREDAGSLAELKKRFAAHGRIFDVSNAKQALFPENSTLVPNPGGTARGFILPLPGGKQLFALPGVPAEMRQMFLETVLPALRRDAGGAPSFLQKSFRCFGLPESRIGGQISRLSLPPEIIQIYRVHFPEVEVLLRGADESALNAAYERCIGAVGAEFVFTREDKDLSLVVHETLLRQKKTLALAESCTGGLTAKLLSDHPGSSEYLLGGVVSYSNALKRLFLSVPAAILEKHGAVSHETAESMARGVREKTGADFALSLTGIAGPGGGSPEKPVGTFFVGFAAQSEVKTFHFYYNSTRGRVRRFAAYAALDILRRHFLKMSQSNVFQAE